MTAEAWLDVPDLPYQVSDLGRVRSVDREILDAEGRWRTFKGRLLTPRRTGRRPDYLHVDLYVAGRLTRFSVHALVLLIFVGEPPAGYQVHHINGNPRDNRLVNLAYMGKSQHLSMHHAGEGNPNARLTLTEAREIRRLREQGVLRACIAQRFGVSLGAVDHILKNRNWKE